MTPDVTVTVRVLVDGYHRWPKAPEHRAYLAARHRHRFVIEPTVVVHHDDRDVEFHDLMAMVHDYLGSEPVEFAAASCERIARMIGEHLSGQGLAVVRVRVAENDEAWSEVRWTPT